MNTAQKVRLHKANNLSLYCDYTRCLYKTKELFCPKHNPAGRPVSAREQDALDKVRFYQEIEN